MQLACDAIKADENFAGKQINIVGLSQGGTIARGVVQQCEGLDVHTLFTFGAAHGGLHAYLNYEWDSAWYKPLKNRLYGNYYSLPPVQEHNAKADNYRMYWWPERWHAQWDFLPDLNNELEINTIYRERILSLKNFGMFYWEDDKTVYPRETCWFSHFDVDGQLLLPRDTPGFQKDSVGL